MLSQSVQPAWLTSIWCVGSETTFWPARRSSWAPWPGPRGPRTTGIGVCWTSPRAAISGCAWTTCAAFSAWAASGSGTGVRCVGYRAILRRNLRKSYGRVRRFSIGSRARGGRRETNGRPESEGQTEKSYDPTTTAGWVRRGGWAKEIGNKRISARQSPRRLNTGKLVVSVHRTDGEDRSGLRVGRRPATEWTYASIYCVLPYVADSNGPVTRLKMGKEGQRWRELCLIGDRLFSRW